MSSRPLKRWVNAIRGAAHRDPNDVSPLGSPMDGGEEERDGEEYGAFASPPSLVAPTASTTAATVAAAKGQEEAAAAAAAANSIPTSASEQSRVMDSLRQSFSSRRNSDLAATGEEADTVARDRSAVKRTTPGRTGREDDLAPLNIVVNSEAAVAAAAAAAADGEGRGGRGGSPGVIGDGRRALRSRSSSAGSPGAPTEDTGPAPTEEGRIWKDEEHVRSKSCVFQ